MSAAELSYAEKFRIALDLHDLGVRLMRENLRRQHPDMNEGEIDELLRAWMQDGPGDAEGRPGTWPRKTS